MRQRHSNIHVYALLAAAFCGVYAAAQNTKTAKSSVVGTFKGADITDEDLRRNAASELELIEIRHLQADAAYERARHQALETALSRIIEDKVLDAEAASRSMTREALLAKELAGKVKKPTMEDLNGHYPANVPLNAENRDKAFARMEPMLKEENYKKAKAEYVAQLKLKYGVKESLEPQRLKVDTTGSPFIGPETAPVIIVEFGDFQCSTCAAFESAMMELQKKYPTQVRLVFKSFSLDRQHAEGAAEAALCAADQGRFWDMHDLLFRTGHAEPEHLNMHATMLNLNMEAFGACMNSGRHAEAVKKDLFAGARLGVLNAPAVFVNGRPLATPHSEAEVARVVEQELRRSTRATAAAQSPTSPPSKGGNATSAVSK